MTAHTAEISADLSCHHCGYDLRAHPEDGKCPECGASVAESRRLAAIPRRPAWRDSDPCWRRRMLAGAWILVLLPLMSAVNTFEWDSSLPVPTVFDFRGTIRTLGDTFLSWGGVYEPLVFCIGIVLLFSKERGRRRGPLDWTWRWGVVCSYVVLLLNATQLLHIVALVLAGIAAIFVGMPPKYQPEVTQWFVDISTAYILYGPHPKESLAIVLAAFSSVVILLACIPLFDALRSSGRKWVAASLLAPLALFSLMHLSQAVRYCLGFPGVRSIDIYFLAVYFRPQLLVRHIAGLPMAWDIFGRAVSGSTFTAFAVESAKWFIVLAIAVWLSIAQLAAWRRGRNASHV